MRKPLYFHVQVTVPLVEGEVNCIQSFALGSLLSFFLCFKVLAGRGAQSQIKLTQED